MRNARFILAILLLGLLALSLTTCASTLKLNGIVVAPVNPVLPVGATQRFTATGFYNDQTSKDITAQVTWTSSNPAVATITNNGLATAISPGITTITATSSTPNSFSSGPSIGTTTLVVISSTLSSISVTPVSANIPVGITQQFVATGAFADGTSFDITSQVTWSSSNPSIATIDSSGLATALVVSPTGTTITATFGTISGSAILSVNLATLTSIRVLPANPLIPVGLIQPFTAFGIFSDGTSFDMTTQVVWSSSNTSVVTVDANGQATAIARGTATITATSLIFLGTISGSTTLTVTPATLTSISVTPATPSLLAGATQQFRASGTYSDGTTFDITTQATWSSSAPTVAAINSNGLATALVASATPATITATLGTISGSTTLTVTSATLNSISVTPANPSLPVGVTQQFTASGTYSDGIVRDITTQVVWTSSNTAVATVTGSGLATAVAAGLGPATITATSGTLSGSTSLTATLATPGSLSVSPANPTISVGATQQFKASGTYSDGTTFDLTARTTWSSSNTSVAIVNRSTGLATAVAAGSTTITAFTPGFVGASTALSVQ